ATGTSALMEDCTFPVERLGEAIEDVQALFIRHGYDNGIIFGHAKDGNLHFVVSQSFAGTAEVAHYKKFNDDLFSLVLDKYQGSLKGEHSTGRAVTPFVETEWGPAAYEVMKRLKRLIDPEVLLNPGIIIGTDPDAYVRHLKVIPAVDPSVDKCIECGFCEKKCPSRDVTLTPRRRIGILRAAERLRKEGRFGEVQELEQAFRYEGLHTCATDGLCALECPVEINTGEVVKELRMDSVSGPAQSISMVVARNFSLATRIVRVGVRMGLFVKRVCSKHSMTRLTGVVRKLIPSLPLWDNAIQAPSMIPASTAALGHREQVVYLPSCVTRMMGGQEADSFFAVCSRAGIGIIIPEAVEEQCCGQSFSSKGYKDAAGLVAARLIERLWEATEGGVHPVVVDVTSCTQTMLSCGPVLPESARLKYGKLRILDSITFAADHLLPKLAITKVPGTLAVHPVCSAQKLGLTDKFIAAARACSSSVVVPNAAGCCGMAGDRGFLFPELTRAATAGESAEVNGAGAESGCTTARTCAMALTSSTGIPYRSLISLVDEASQPKA
ncbi:MAG: FAD-binding and (Fe-S)-binding domain-containing protein, partial [Bacteroidota bacterium]